MKVWVERGRVHVAREGKERVSSESRLLYQVKRELQAMGFDVVKKPMWKDDHLVADTQHYIRERRGSWAVFDDQYAIRNAAKDFHRRGRVSYALVGEM